MRTVKPSIPRSAEDAGWGRTQRPAPDDNSLGSLNFFGGLERTQGMSQPFGTGLVHTRWPLANFNAHSQSPANIRILLCPVWIGPIDLHGPKSISKRAGELYAAGFNEQAANLYTMALRKKPGYVDAMVGLKMTGQGVMDVHIGEFQRAALAGRRADAIAEYDKMMAFKTKVAAVGVVLLVPATVEADHADLVDEHLIELDEAGHAQLEEEDFEAAEATFKEILRLDPAYGDAADLLIVARAEPKYRVGKTALEDGRFREAHSNLGLVLALDKDYKDASTLHQEALETGRFNVAISDFDSRNRDRDVALELRSGVQRGLLDSSDPFVGVVDRTLREDILAEQELSLSGMSDETVAVGEIAGARAILTGAVLTYSSETGSPLSTSRNGYRKYFREVKDDEGKIKKVAAFSRPATICTRSAAACSSSSRSSSSAPKRRGVLRSRAGPRPGCGGIRRESGARRQPLPGPRQWRSRPQRQIPHERPPRRAAPTRHRVCPPRPGDPGGHRTRKAGH